MSGQEDLIQHSILNNITMNEKIIKTTIVYILGHKGYKNYIKDMGGMESIKILDIIHKDFIDNEEKLSYILNKFVYPNIKNFNDFFTNFIFKKSLIRSKIKNKNYFNECFKKLISYCNCKEIPILRFPICIDNIYNEKNEISYFINDPNDSSKGYIIFKDAHDPNLKELDLKIEDELIISLAHEIGHAIDEPVDFKKINNDDLYYKYHREEEAWNNAKKILENLRIYNTSFEEQSKVCLKNYREKYFGEK